MADINLPEIDLGRNVFNIRKLYNMTIRELAEASGVTASLVSQIERGVANPSISTLKAISDATGEPLYNFFLPSMEEARDSLINRADSRNRFVLSPVEGGVSDRPDGYVCERITAIKDCSLEMLRISLPPHSANGAKARLHKGDEVSYLEKGTLKLWLGDQLEELHERDSVTIPANTPHQWINESDETAILVLAVSTK